MKKLTEIRKEKAIYFVCVNGENKFESESLKRCKDWLCTFLNYYKQHNIEIKDKYNYFIGMYSITID